MGLEIVGFAEAVEKAWESHGLCPFAAQSCLLARLPYSHPESRTIDHGFARQGCYRESDRGRGPYIFDNTDHLRRYLREQLINHVGQCEPAALMVSGARLPCIKETTLWRSLRSSAYKY